MFRVLAAVLISALLASCTARVDGHPSGSGLPPSRLTSAMTAASAHWDRRRRGAANPATAGLVPRFGAPPQHPRCGHFDGRRKRVASETSDKAEADEQTGALITRSAPGTFCLNQHLCEFPNSDRFMRACYVGANSGARSVRGTQINFGSAITMPGEAVNHSRPLRRRTHHEFASRAQAAKTRRGPV